MGVPGGGGGGGGGPDLSANPFVGALGAPVPAPNLNFVAPGSLGGLRARGAPAQGAESPDRRSFVGYLGRTFNHGGVEWSILYRDLSLETWLIIETQGIVGRRRIFAAAGSGSPADLDVLWVLVDATVGQGGRSLSSLGAFLSGQFTRAGDFEASPSGGTLDASTGVFCEGRSPGCCKGCTYRTPKTG